MIFPLVSLSLFVLLCGRITGQTIQHDLTELQLREFEHEQRLSRRLQSSSSSLSPHPTHTHHGGNGNGNNGTLPVKVIEKKLSHYEQLNPRPCGTDWQQSYAKFHSDMLLSAKPKLLVSVPNLSGLADRIIGIASSFVIAFLTERALQVANRHPLPPLSLAFDSPHINFSRPAAYEEDWVIEPLMHKARVRNFNESVLATKEFFAVNTIDDWKLQDRLLRQNLHDLMGGDALTTFIAINRGKTIRMFENSHHQSKLKATGLTPQTAFGCVTSYLLQPKPEIFQHISPPVFMKMVSTANDVLKIAIQIRAGDWYLENAKHNIDVKQFSAFFQCAQQIETFALADEKTSYKSAVWYLVTDSQPLREAALRQYGSEKVVTSAQSVIEHSSKESSVCGKKDGANAHACDVSTVGVQTAAAEWWLMKYARYHVISEHSGFGRSAAMNSLHKNSIYTVGHNQAAKAINCDAKSFTPLGDLPFYWSGI